MRLANLQNAYSLSIYGADTQPLESLILGSTYFTTQKRVNIYRNNTLGSLKSALSHTFPVCETLVGTDYFNQLATSHVLRNPSRQRNLDCYGEGFPLTLKALIKERQELQELEYLEDIAQLEWLLHQSYYAKDRGSFDFDRFALLSAEQQMQVRFKLAEDVRLLASSYPVHDIWESHQVQGQDLVKEDREKKERVDDVSFNHQARYYILVQREKLQPRPLLIDQSLYQLLVAIVQGSELLDLSQYLAQPVEECTHDIATLIQQGLICDFK